MLAASSSSLSNLGARLYTKVDVIIDGKKYIGDDSQTIRDLLIKNKIQVPAMCGDHGSCQLCTVLVNGKEHLSCNTHIEENMNIVTNSDELKEKVLTSISKITSKKPSIVNGEKLIVDPHQKLDYVDRTTHSIQLDYSKCNDCGKCVDACEHDVFLMNPHLQTAGYFGLSAAHCTSCGICMDSCETGAISLTDNILLYKEAMANSQHFKVAVLDSAIFYNLETKLGLQRGSLTLESVCALLKNMGFEYFLDYSIIADAEIIKDAARIHRHSSKGFAQTIGSYCPSLTKKLLNVDPTGAEHVVDAFLGPQLNLTTVVVTDSPARRSNSTLYFGNPRTITSVGLTTDEFVKVIKEGGYKFDGAPCKMFPLGSEQGCKAYTADRFADYVVQTFGFTHLGAHFGDLKFKQVDPLVSVAEFPYRPHSTLRAAVVDGTKGLDRLYELDLADVIYISPKDGNKCDAPVEAMPQIDEMAVRRNIKHAQDNQSAMEIWRYFMKQEDDEEYINKRCGYYD